MNYKIRVKNLEESIVAQKIAFETFKCYWNNNEINEKTFHSLFLVGYIIKLDNESMVDDLDQYFREIQEFRELKLTKKLNKLQREVGTIIAQKDGYYLLEIK